MLRINTRIRYEAPLLPHPCPNQLLITFSPTTLEVHTIGENMAPARYSHHQCTRIPIVPLWKGRKAASFKRISCRTKQTNFSITMAPSVHRLNYGPSEIWLEWPSVGLLRGVFESGHSLDRTALLCVALRCCISSTVSSTMSSSMPSLS